MAPVIGISTNYLTVDQGKFLGMERVYVNKDYVEAVTKAGGIPLLLPPVEAPESLQRYLAICNGFILSGGGDINPLLFGEAPHPKLEAIHTALDRAQGLLVSEILQTSKPLLAICRGLQLLNVVQGGTLWQDISEISSTTLLHSQNSPRSDKFHEVRINEDSVLGELFGGQLQVNSFHHQCIKTLGKHLKVVATAPDGVVEAIELTDRTFGVGVQWHPEMLLTASDEMLPLFQGLVTASHSDSLIVNSSNLV